VCYIVLIFVNALYRGPYLAVKTISRVHQFEYGNLLDDTWTAGVPGVF
jgi:hypothetical protein